MAILLQEERLYQRCRIYGTDIQETTLRKAKDGIFPLAEMQEYTRNYLQAGGKKSFSEYYLTQYDHAIFLPFLKQNLVFAQHNLVTDASFQEFHAIICRNVLIYFNKSLQDRVHELLYKSLVPSGFLGLGKEESIRFSPYADRYEEVAGDENLYRKVK
jgi:chemotaxis protein methyltransferase CheR